MNYNEIVTNYNTRLSVFPNVLIAKVGGFRPYSLIHSSDFERAAVDVQFAEWAGQ
jgi:hypothetical protein